MSENTLCATNEPTTESENGACESRPEAVFCPQIDLVDSGEAVTVWADVPGADEASLDISVEQKTVTVRAEIEPPSFEGLNPIRREYRVGHYERTFAISNEIDREGIEAEIAHGVLKLTLPKTKYAASRKVTVKATPTL